MTERESTKDKLGLVVVNQTISRPFGETVFFGLHLLNNHDGEKMELHLFSQLFKIANKVKTEGLGPKSSMDFECNVFFFIRHKKGIELWAAW